MSCDSTLSCYPILSNFLSLSFTYSILSYLFLLNHVNSYSNLFSVISFLWPNLFLSPIFIFSYTLFYLPLIIYPFVYLCLSYRFLPYELSLSLCPLIYCSLSLNINLYILLYIYLYFPLSISSLIKRSSFPFLCLHFTYLSNTYLI